MKEPVNERDIIVEESIHETTPGFDDTVYTDTQVPNKEYSSNVGFYLVVVAVIVAIIFLISYIG